MIDIAKHIRIFSIDPDDDFVTKRTAAIKAIEDVFRKSTTIEDIIRLANRISLGIHSPSTLDQSIVDIVEKALKKQSPSFVVEGQELQISTCATIACLQYLDKISEANASTKISVGDVLGLAVWSAVSFQKKNTGTPKAEALREEILQIAKKVTYNDSLTTRKRLSINELSAIPTAEDTTTLATNIVNTIAPLLNKFQTNAILDREEIDILWWKLNNWSVLLETNYSQLTQIQAGIVKGLELSTLLRRLPHHAHYRMIIEDANIDEAFNGEEIIQQIGDIQPTLAGFLGKFKLVAENPEVYPLLNILSGNKVDNFLDEKRPLSDWIGRALLEGTLLHLGKLLRDGD